MSLYRRNSVYYVNYTPQGGARVRLSTGTTDRKEAQRFHDKTVAETWRIQKLGEKVRRTWEEAAVRWSKERGTKASIKDDVQRLRWLDKYLHGLFLDQIDRDKLEAITQAKLEDGASNGTVNRHLALIRAILFRARDEWQWVSEVPKVRMLQEPKGRTRFLTRDEAETLARALPEHLEAPFRLGFLTGLRQRNLFELTWEQVDLTKGLLWVHAHQAKARKPIGVPLSDEAVALLRRQRGKHPRLVFSRDGRPLKKLDSKTWARALERAGLGREVCWHVATRHSWASWLAMAGASTSALQTLGGWSSPAMPARYAHYSVDHLRQLVNRTARPLVRVTTASQ
jgi:integrase